MNCIDKCVQLGSNDNTRKMEAKMNRCVKGFLRALGTKMVNGEGEEVILKGWGAGNWMNPEGFMVSGYTMGFGAPAPKEGSRVGLPGRYDRGRSIRNTITELCGAKYAESFFQRWYRAYLTEGDIQEMSRWGYNSIRLPLDAAALLYEEPGIHFNEETFGALDYVLGLCEQYGLYVILDLHGTPGHSGVPCDNGLDNVPRLFLEEETFERMIFLWEELARRYKDRWIIGAYELLNEPLFPAWIHLKDRLVEFYKQTITRIRAIDQHHMLLLSGPVVGTDQSIFTEDFDPKFHNWGYTFHGYHWLPEEPSFQKYLETSRRLQIPCMHGEGREPINWMPTYYEMLENWHIGYNLFCWKSEGLSGMENSPVTHLFPDGWDAVVSYIRDGGPRPSYQKAQNLYDRLLELVQFENCQVDERMFQYSLRIPPLTIGGAGYDSYGGPEVSFSGHWLGGNVLDYRLADRTKLVSIPGYQVPPARMGAFRSGNKEDPMTSLSLELKADEFACYSVCNKKASCNGFTSLSVISTEATIQIHCCQKQTNLKLVQGTQTLGPFSIGAGNRQTLRINVTQGIVRIEKVFFELPNEVKM